jgi:outer membrane protein, adhesin transport system
MTSKNILILAAFSAGMFLASSAWSSADAASLEEAVSLAIGTNPRVGVVSNDRKAVDEELRQGVALYYPSVDLQASSGADWNENATTAACCSGNDRTLWRNQATLTISQLLFDGHFADNEVARQEARVKSAAYRVSEAAEFVGLDAIEAYLEVLRHRDRLVNSEQNVIVHQNTLGDVQLRSQAGGGNIADVRQAEARLASAESAMTQIRGDLNDAEYRYINVVGVAPDSLSTPTVPYDLLPASLEDSVAVSLANSPTIAFSRADVETAAAEAAQQTAAYWPDLRLELTGDVTDNDSGSTRTDYNASALVVMRWNLYRGGADSARVREFKHRLAEATDQLLINERQVAEDARVSWNAIQTARQSVEILKREVDANQSTRDVYRQQFDIGQRGLLDLLDSDNELFLSRDSLITATYAEMFAAYRLLATSGSLVEALGLQEPETAMQASME